MKSAGISRTITESSAFHESGEAKKHFTKAGDQDTNEKRMIDTDPHSAIDMEQ